MSRADFTYQSKIPINDILLDHENARIRTGSDQNDCIARILRKEDQLLALMEDIAKNGLTTMPILVSPIEGGKWCVKDGNRRITSLKLLNDPERCPDDHLKPKIRAIQNKYLANIPSEVDCLSSSDEEAIIREVVARHSGAMGGIGQLDWSAYLRTVYLLNHGHPADYKRAGQYVFWAEKQGLIVEDDFPITSVTRFFNSDNLALLGFKIEKDVLVPTLSLDKVKHMATRVILDFGTKKVIVEDVFTPEKAKVYIESVRVAAGIISSSSTNKKATTTGETSGTEKGKADSDSNNMGSGSSTDTGSNATGRRGPSSPRKQPWDRKKLFGKIGPGFSVPDKEVKVRTIVTELRLLDVKETPFATTMLFRALLELSDEHYRKKKGIQDKKSLSKNVAASADSMLNLRLLDKSEHEAVKAYTETTTSMLHVDSLQKMLHRNTHHADYQIINTFWDGIGCFVRACWSV